MPALDTNVLVRWLTRDDDAQYAIVERLLRSAIDSGEPLFIPVTVLLETEWVLRSRYHFDRAASTMAMDAMLCAAEFDFQHEPAVERALWLFKQEGSPDFADCMHIGLASASDREPLLTFDMQAARLAGARLLA